ncbi:MAG: GGDEF domain-containing protein [Gammaproteobacteria bacterium]|nr:GGDEF domain-containing protein [Gammaproteobacteria bacterium]
MTSLSQSAHTSITLKLLDAAEQKLADFDVIQTHLKSVLSAQEGEQQRQHQAYCSLFATLTTHLSQQTKISRPHQQHLALLQLRLSHQPGLSELNEIGNLLTNILTLNQETGTTATTVKSESQTETAETVQLKQTAPHIDSPPLAPLITTPELPPDSNEFLALETRRKRMAQIQRTLSLHLSEVVEQNQTLGNALSNEQHNIDNSHDIGELQALKVKFSSKISTLLQGHQSLTEKLKNASKFMQIIESEGQDLSNELKKAHTLSLTDELTQLPNRRAFMKRIEDEVSRVQRYASPLCFALIDLDSFKSINDRYGHTIGDEVLRSFAERALSGFRHHDLASRYGGEEFAIILPNTDTNGAVRALEKVKGRTSQCTFQYNGTTYPIPTFSAGIAQYSAGETPASLIERADKALYRAKRMGRNRIETTEVNEREVIVASTLKQPHKPEER